MDFVSDVCLCMAVTRGCPARPLLLGMVRLRGSFLASIFLMDFLKNYTSHEASVMPDALFACGGLVHFTALPEGRRWGRGEGDNSEISHVCLANSIKRSPDRQLGGRNTASIITQEVGGRKAAGIRRAKDSMRSGREKDEETL